jgi:hypothetical protein
MNRRPRRPRVVLYLGAGASSFAGYQTFVTFPELLFNDDLRKVEGLPPLSPNSARILTAIRESLRRNNKATTHDNFLWRLDGYTQFLRLNQCDEALQDFLRNNTRLYDLHICTEQAINQICATTIGHYSLNRVAAARDSKSIVYTHLRRIYQLYCQLAQLNGDSPWLPVFTTNYDMLMEDLDAEFGSTTDSRFPLTNGIDGLTTEKAPLTPSLLCSSDAATTGFNLWRLHGCVCWFYDPARSEIGFLRNRAIEQEKVRMCVMYPGNETEHVGNDPYGFAFRSFYRHLQTCDLVVFIGFSFRDDDVMHVLLKALEERRGSLRLLVVDPLYSSDDVRASLKGAASRTTMPVRVPEMKEVDSLTMPFGESEDLDAKVLTACKEILARKGKAK